MLGYGPIRLITVCFSPRPPKGHGKTPKDAASVRATHPIPAACGVYYFEVKIISKGRDGYGHETLCIISPPGRSDLYS